MSDVASAGRFGLAKRAAHSIRRCRRLALHFRTSSTVRVTAREPRRSPPTCSMYGRLRLLNRSSAARRRRRATARRAGRAPKHPAHPRAIHLGTLSVLKVRRELPDCWGRHASSSGRALVLQEALWPRPSPRAGSRSSVVVRACQRGESPPARAARSTGWAQEGGHSLFTARRRAGQVLSCETTNGLL